MSLGSPVSSRQASPYSRLPSGRLRSCTRVQPRTRPLRSPCYRDRHFTNANISFFLIEAGHQRPGLPLPVLPRPGPGLFLCTDEPHRHRARCRDAPPHPPRVGLLTDGSARNALRYRCSGSRRGVPIFAGSRKVSRSSPPFSRSSSSGLPAGYPCSDPKSSWTTAPRI